MLPCARSAVRVHSVSLRLVCDRELEIERFVAREYWSIVARLATPRNEVFEARLVGADGKKITRLDIGSGAEAEGFTRDLETAAFRIVSVEAKPARRNPPPPFTTSTMQQEASRKLGFSPAHTMRLAQRLYEGIDIGGETVGLITYMRTDGIDMAPEAITAVRGMIGKQYGKEYVPDAPRQYQNKSKNAQEAHEAVRPTDPDRLPASVAKTLDRDQARLYELIWNRAVASQMQSAELERTTVDIAAKVGARNLELRATGQVVKFDGFLTLYQEGFDEPAEDDESRRLPAMSEGEALAKQAINSTQHFTEPPPRYSEASLVKRMEELGIGRPSTYAAILQVLQDRGYVRIEKKRLMPEDKGRVVVGFLESFFQRYVEYDFTANLEEQLDRVSNNEVAWKTVLHDFWTDFIGAVNDIKELRVTNVLDALYDLLEPHIFPQPADGSDRRKCPNCATGKLSLKLGRFGAFIGCSNYPECNFTRQMSPGAEGAVNGTKVLGEDPATGLEVTLRGGRFGPYLQLGETSKEKDAPKPKRAGIPKGVSPDDVDLEKALGLLALPRDVGPHPEDGEMIVAGIGRFGPYVKHGKTYANIEDGDEVMSIGLNRAVTLIAEKILKPGKGRRFGADPGKALGDHPDKGGPIVVKKGRYGPYVSHDGVNATLPNDITPETVTLEQAVSLIDARVAAGGGKKKSARGKAAKAPAKKGKAAKPAAEGKAEAVASTARRTAGRKVASGKAPAKAAAPKKPAAKPARKAKAAD
jgi:DNA topoisomerase-1